VAFAREQSSPDHVLPKGGVDDDETELDAARREIAEEIGLTSLTLLDDLGVRERLSGNKKRWTRCRYFLFLTDEYDGQPSDTKRRYVGPVWFLLDKLPQLVWPEQRELIESNRERIVAAVRSHSNAEGE
jgi:8-oxo-dGTP pyrophosphatase MutT (NUDIX family)